ncbi:LacI family DNA-binding transcriptional regulator [Martelella endophytica]|uniref:LacI family transcriptional regulator n=1 Tax=Martelella endophytica TaxID=1486262 RepID=A0A0D5LLV0_MAREN|nr:LacI family DNA-binding transcriptional regulator [Martelella endophytica]AJY45131.1 LacI family transcriptional regulator [Martelella endophytica]
MHMKKESRRVRLSDLARYCGVSPSTASRALSGTPGVRPELREKILQAAKSQNYHVPMSIAGLKVIVAASASAMLDYQRNQFTAFVLEGMRERAEILGLSLATKAISNAEDERRMLDEAAGDPEIAGVLMLTIDEDEMLVPARAFRKPVLLVNGDDPLMRLSSIAPHNRAAAALATRYLKSLGHSRILFLARPGRRTILRRLEGWRDEIETIEGVHWRDLVVDATDWTPEAAIEAIRRHVGEKGNAFTAVLAAGDSLAAGAIFGLRELGLSVPGDVSVMGIDGLPQSDFLDPPLTTVQIPMREMGAAALDMIRDLLDNEPFLSRRTELSCSLTERGSTARAKGGKG